MTSYFVQAFIYLAAAVVMVPIAKRLGLGSVLGYLIAGVLIGPVIGLVGQETNTIQHFAEFGVVMMLFLVGLELEPKSLWSMRAKLFGLGGLQVTITIVLMMVIALAFGQSVTTALAIGLIFSLSSTAIVLQTFNEKGLSKTIGGRTAFSVLLFQDIAVIPMLALIPLLAVPELMNAVDGLQEAAKHHEELSLVAGMPGWAHGLIVILSIVAVVVGGHFLSWPLFRFVADSGLREVFTAAALMLVIGIAALMSLVGLSPALGAFLAGVVLANSEFKHELEANIEPFKGLLLGLFFITVGAGVNFQILSENLTLIIGLTMLLMFGKAAVLLVLAKMFKVKGSNSWLFVLSLAQTGEFGFVLLTYSVNQYVIPLETAQLLSMVVGLSMFLTPLLFILYEKVIVPHYSRRNDEEQREADDIDETGSVIIAGIGRFGQIVNRMLVANGIKTVVLDTRPSQIDMMRQINTKTYFGDATHADLLELAGIDEAKLFVIAFADRVRSVELTQFLRKNYPHLKILARAYDRGHNYELKDAGADIIMSESYWSSLELGKEALRELGIHPFHAEQMKQRFLRLDTGNSDDLYKSWREEGEERSFGEHYRKLFMQLEEMIAEAMKKDRNDGHTDTERGWTPPPRNYTDQFDDN